MTIVYQNSTILPLPMNIDKALNNSVAKEKWAIVTLSKDGMAMANRVKNVLEDKSLDLYTKEKYALKKTEIKIINTDIGSFFGEIFNQYDMICCIMATGIVVRGIAPYLVHKSKDPGILVMDTQGDYVISLLSGHLGGANTAASLLAKRLEALPVITTGTDVKGTMAVDILAQKIDCTIENFTDAKEVTACILNDESVGFLNQEACDLKGIVLPGNIRVLLKEESSISAGIYTSIKDKEAFERNHKPWVKLVPKKIVFGIGCRKETAAKKIITAVKTVLTMLGLSENAIHSFSTIELKENEPGILIACDFFKAKKIIIPDPMIQMVQSRFEGSDFVFKTTGVYAVSEPCGYIASGFGDCLLKKQKLDGITLSVWKIKNLKN